MRAPPARGVPEGVDLIVWAIGAGWVVLVGVFLYVGFNADDPGGPILRFLLTMGVTVLGLLMVVMRALCGRPPRCGPTRKR